MGNRRGFDNRGRLHRRQGSGRRKRGWLAAAREAVPVLIGLPLAAFGAVWFADGPPVAQSLPGIGSGMIGPEAAVGPAPLADTIDAQFAPCGGGARTNCVVDGDTIWLGGEKIRLADINTPEVSDPGCAHEAQLGARATKRLTQLLNEGAFALAPNPDGRSEDRYGRKLRILTRDGTSLGATLVREGLAEEWQGYRRDWC